MTEQRLAELIMASHRALRRPDLDPRVRLLIGRILARAQARVREMLG